MPKKVTWLTPPFIFLTFELCRQNILTR